MPSLAAAAPDADEPRTEHGGGLGKGRRKEARPFVEGQPLLVVLRSTRAKGPWSIQKPAVRASFRALSQQVGKRFHVKVHGMAVVGQELHVLISCQARENLRSFLRTFGGVTARAVTGARKGDPQGRFWDGLVYSRMVEPGKDLTTVRSFLQSNA